MAADWFVDFPKGKVPSKEDVGKALEDYLGAYAEGIHWDGNRWFAKLVGTKSWPFKRLEADSRFAARYEEEAKEPRWIEVFIDTNNIDVITRRSDEATNNLAEGFAKLLARYWQGKRRPD